MQMVELGLASQSMIDQRNGGVPGVGCEVKTGFFLRWEKLQYVCMLMGMIQQLYIKHFH